MTTEAKVGAFTLIGIVLFAAVAVLLSGVHFGADKGYVLYAGFKQVVGVMPQSTVRLSGVPVGTVKAIENDGNGVTVTLAIKEGTKIPRGSKVSIGSDGVMGDKYINISPSADKGSYLVDGDFLIGTEASGMDDMFAEATDLLKEAKDVVKSMHDITGNADFQKNILLMVVNIKDTAAHLNGMLAALEQTVQQNQGNINGILANLNAAMAGLNSTMQSTEAMMANLATVGADPQTAENLRTTLQNITDASARIAHISETLDASIGDPETGKELKETIANARDVSARAKKSMEKLDELKLRGNVDVLYSGGEHDWKTNFNVDIGKEGSAFLRVGADNIGDDTEANVQVGKRQGSLVGRAGLMQGDMGVGVDYYPKDSLRVSADYYDFDDGKLRMQAAYRLGGSDTWLMGQMDNVNDGDKRATYFGISQSF